MIRRTKKLENHISAGISTQNSEILNQTRKDILLRASAFLLLKDSKASFTIEGESPKSSRTLRWGQAIAQAGLHDLNRNELIRLQQLVIENNRFIVMGFRKKGGFIGENDRNTGEPIPDHISAKWQDLDNLIDGLIETANTLTNSSIDAVLAATIIAFGFVNSGVVTYEEPFLLNYGLRKDKFRRKLNTDNKPITQKANINPNPCSDYAIISFNLHFESSINTRLEIINIQGVTVKTFNLPETLNQFVLPLSDLNSGVYIVSLKSDNKIIENHKIIVI